MERPRGPAAGRESPSRLRAQHRAGAGHTASRWVRRTRPRMSERADGVAWAAGSRLIRHRLHPSTWGPSPAAEVLAGPLLSHRVCPARHVGPASCVDSGGPRLPELGGPPRLLSAGPRAACILGEARTQSGHSPGTARPLTLPGLGGDARGSARSPVGPCALPRPR